MSPRFSVTVDPDRNLVTVDLAGFFTPVNVQGFATELRAAYRRLRCPRNRHVTLCDLSQMNIQSQDVVNAFAAVVRDPELMAERLAMVVGVSLARLQAKRLSPPDRVGLGFFYDRAEAEAWLFSADRTDARYPHVPASPTSDGRDCTVRSAA